MEVARQQYQAVLQHCRSIVLYYSSNNFSFPPQITDMLLSLVPVPGHIETIVRFANFERRTSPDDLTAAEHVYVSQLGQENVDETTQTAIVTLYAKFLWQTKKDVGRAREIFKTGEGKFDSRFYFSTYLQFEMDQPGKGIVVMSMCFMVRRMQSVHQTISWGMLYG